MNGESPFGPGARAGYRDARGGRDVGPGNQRNDDRIRRLENLRASQLPIEAIPALDSDVLDVQAALEALSVWATNFAPLVAAPATASSSGNAGSIAYDSDYLYVCVAINTWKRVGLSTW